jgi:nucleoside-diphosphate-sugar epimerase
MIAITGGSGHLGANLVRRVAADGARVRVLVHDDARAFAGLDVERVPGDVTDARAVRELVDGADVVFHLAAAISLRAEDEPLTERINVGGTANVIAACRDARVRRLVHLSSIHAFAPEPLDQPVDESRGPAEGPGTLHYDRSKARGEALVRAAAADGLDAVVLNPTGMLGPFDWRPSDIGAFFIGLLRGALPGLVNADFDWCDARDVAEACVTAAERARRGDRFVLAGHRISLPELARLTHEFGGPRPPRMVSPMWLAKMSLPFVAGWAKLRGVPPLYSRESLHVLECFKQVRGERAARELGFQPRPARDTVRDTVAWLRESHHVTPAVASG